MQCWIGLVLIRLTLLSKVNKHLLALLILILEQFYSRLTLDFVVSCGLVHLRDEVRQVVLVMVLKRMVHPSLCALEFQSILFSS